jgi:hypothetical protein
MEVSEIGITFHDEGYTCGNFTKGVIGALHPARPGRRHAETRRLVSCSEARACPAACKPPCRAWLGRNAASLRFFGAWLAWALLVTRP